ncbi:acetoin ABC transporter permease [Lactiplantibacillus daowaiensis]|uniref:Acetoin ABC transporter permease n=1 Tax=Lactiplantibacillus daowaiensis TaxID=2559918 RepID=A0ABW1S507_9LACO|nr:acetoin ABC transporter permease [Lactiplantibacillus daowaiensis]
MTQQTLRQLLWRRYRAAFTTTLIVMLVAGIKAATDLVHSQSRLFTNTGYVASNSDITMLMVAFLATTILGWLVFAWDNHTDFNHYLFALPVTRRQIYRQKVRLLIETVVVGYIGMQVLFLGLLRLIKRPTAVYNLNWGTDLRYLISQLLFLVAMLMITATWGLILGQVVASALTTVIFIGSLIFLVEGASNIVADVFRVKLWRVAWLGNIDQSTWTGFSVFVVVSLIIIIGLIYLGRVAFEHLSLENMGDYLVFPKCRQLFLWLVIAYLTVAISFSSFGTLLLQLVTNNYSESVPWYQSTLMGPIVAYLTWSIGRWILYRPDHVSDAFKFKKI